MRRAIELIYLGTMNETPKRLLLATTTQEAFQPVRLSYEIPSKLFVVARLRELACMVEAPTEKCWQWLYDAEAASIRFAGSYDDVPVEIRPIVLGRLRFPKRGGMTFTTNSIDRAIQGARFFAPRLGPKVVAIRCRVVNRCFAASEGTPADLLKTLDQNVTVIDPRVAEAAMEREFEGARSNADVERLSAERLQRRIESKEDVPPVEDFPLWPEEETPDFGSLAMALQLRGVRAVEHWRGNTELTLTALIMQMAQEGSPLRSKKPDSRS